MVEFSEDHIKNCCIPFEVDMIKYYAWEMGQMQAMLEKEQDNTQRQWYQYFFSVAEQEMENASKRLQEHRQQLINYRLLQDTVS
jgi:hypothetical protein